MNLLFLANGQKYAITEPSLDFTHYLAGFLRVNESGEEWLDDSPLSGPRELLPIPTDCIAVLVEDRYSQKIAFWDVVTK